MKKYINAGCVHVLLISIFISLFVGVFGVSIPTVSAMAIAPHVCCSSVAFIPGFEGSRLYEPSLLGEDQLWEPNWNKDVEKLYLNQEGQSIRTDIYTRDIIDESKIGGFNIYKTFGESMDRLVSDGVIREWKALPYDWRKDISDVVVGGSTIKDEAGEFDVLNFADEIDRMSESSISGKVTIIGHSNGGLITKLLIQELERRGEVDLVDKVILVAVPELGTPKAIPALLHGYGQELGFGFFLSESVARNLAKNMQSAFNLLPSREYFNRVSDPVVVIDPSVESLSSLTSYGTEIDSFDDMQSFLSGQKDTRTNPANGDITKPIVLNTTFLAKSDDTHGLIDNWQFPDSIAVSQIAGWGLDTLSGIKYTAGKDCGISSGVCVPMLDEVPVFTNDGDNTVVSPSATAVNTINTKTYYVNLPEYNAELYGLRLNRGHANILEVGQLQQLIGNIISGSNSLPNLITFDKPQSNTDQSDGLHISVHSPVSIDAYDSEGNHTGLIANPNPNSDIQLVEENIPNSFYMNFGEGKYIGLPENILTTIKLQGTGYGTFTLNVNEDVFTDVPVTPLTVARIDTTTTDAPQLILDVEGDGNDDYIIKPDTNFDPILYLQSMKQVVVSLDLKKAVEKNLLTKIDKLLELIKKGKITNVESKIQKYIFRMQKKKAKRIDENDKVQFISMLNQLLDNTNK